MKRILLAAIAITITMATHAQADSTGKADTIKIGGMIIIKKSGKDTSEKGRDVVISNRRTKKSSNLTTNWWIFDLGFANYTDNTNYSQTGFSGLTGPGVNKDAFKLRSGKSVNVNIWMFMQRLNLIKHYVNLKYGLGVELNNYRFEEEDLVISKNPTRFNLAQVSTNPRIVEKNKLAADYVTVPVLLNFNFTPGRKSGFGFSAGVSGGYLYSARQKFKFSDDKKDKTKGDFDLNKWKVSYIGELSLGPVRLYGSVATQTMWDNALDQRPYNVGLRFSNF